jgi:sigma-B regulation protein RsbU (phosphoserine phosphatase)
VESSGFYDLFLIDNDGNVVYTVFKEIDFATKLWAGPHTASGLGRVFRRAEVGGETVSVEDFAPYGPSYNEPAAFFATAVYLDGEKVGVVAVQAPIDAINDVMTNSRQWEAVGLGESGETYLVADDLTMRNDSRFLVEDRSRYLGALIAQSSIPFDVVKTIDRFDSSIGLQPVYTEGARSALSGVAGEAIFLDYRGVPVLSSFRPLTMPGLNWAIMSEIDEAEAFRGVEDLRNRSFAMILLGGAVLLTATFLFASRLSKPLRQLEGEAADLSHYDFTSDVPYTSETLARVAERHDEIGELAQGFQSMGGDLSRSVRETVDAVEAREAIEAELSVANEIQMSMLPLTFPKFPEHTEFAIHARLVPAKEVGGDFYEFGFVDEDRFFFCVGDVSGKGVPAALFMAATKTLIRSGALQGETPGDLLSRINEELSRENPEFMFATIWLGVLDLRTGTVTFANAGHNPPFFLSSTVTSVEEAHGPMVGPLQGTSYGQSELDLASGDMLVVYSDGVTEAMDPAGSLFGEERLRDTVAGAPPSVTGVTDAVEREALDWEQGERSDDLTVLVVQFLSPRRVAGFQMIMPTKGELSQQIVEDIHLLNESFGRFAAAREISANVTRPVQVALDEILVNVAAHSGAMAVTVRAWLDATSLRVEISDDGVPFDPSVEVQAPDISSALVDRGSGGLGVHLVRSLMDEVEYVHRGGRNIITLTKRSEEGS